MYPLIIALILWPRFLVFSTLYWQVKENWSQRTTVWTITAMICIYENVTDLSRTRDGRTRYGCLGWGGKGGALFAKVAWGLALGCKEFVWWGWKRENVVLKGTTKGTCHSVRIIRVFVLSGLSEKKVIDVCFIDIKSKADKKRGRVGIKAAQKAREVRHILTSRRQKTLFEQGSNTGRQTDSSKSNMSR